MKLPNIKSVSVFALSIAFSFGVSANAFAEEVSSDGLQVEDDVISESDSDLNQDSNQQLEPEPEPEPEIVVKPTPAPDPKFVKKSTSYSSSGKTFTVYKGKTVPFSVLKTVVYVSTNPKVKSQTKTTVSTVKPTKVKYSSASSKIVKIGEDGIITARRCGFTTVTAVYKKKTYTCKVLVLNPLSTKVANQNCVVAYNASKSNAIVKRGMKWVGKGVYKAGACKKGYFDCSGFVSYVVAGKRIGNTHSFLTRTKVKNPQPGDICVRNTHAGIYIGSGLMVHAVGKGKGVKVSKVERGMKYVRIYK